MKNLLALTAILAGLITLAGSPGLALQLGGAVLLIGALALLIGRTFLR